jgi:DNA-binding response OmpR family regulator
MIRKAYVIVEDKLLREVIVKMLEFRDFKVESFSNRLDCPLLSDQNIDVSKRNDAADIFIAEINLPNLQKLELLKKQIIKGCNAHLIAVISARWTIKSLYWARSLGINAFNKPFNSTGFHQWLLGYKESMNIIKQHPD